MSETLMELDRVCCGYGNRTVIKDISLQLKSGEILCLLGPNGVGKTTLFKTILGFLKIKGGKILIEGEEITNWGRKEMAKAIAYVPQSHHPAFPFTVMDIVLMGRSVNLGFLSSPTQKDYEMAEEIMESLGIVDLKDKIYTEISGGQQQMVLIARAMIQNAKILIMDEPTSSLDYGNQVKILEQIDLLRKKGFSVIMTSHYPNHAFLCATKVALLQRNQCFITGNVDEVVMEDNLRNTYGIDVKITSVRNEAGNIVKGCIPLLSM
jgi:iron complex transport system ATP-binding protein